MIKLFGFLPLTVAVFLSSFAASALSGLILIPWLRRLKIGQTVREEGLKSHYAKNGTPLMGGLLFLSAMVIVGVPICLAGYNILPYMLVTLGCGLVGFADDWTKAVLKRSKGVSGMQKMLALGLVSILFVAWCLLGGTDIRNLVIPFAGMDAPWTAPFWLAGALGIFILLAFTNGVNLTDGVDGLAGSVTLVALTVLGVLFSFRPELDAVRLFSALMAGGVLGYLLYNFHPAKVFMGDTGSLALGAAVSSVAIAAGVPLLFIIAGIIYVVEDLSVMIQVFWFKRTGRRVFRMAPIHHHFEMGGWKENKIVLAFSGAGILFGLLALLASR
jgi:phospho-N-acetylmuramoyl-pentapeptide-transferase